MVTGRLAVVLLSYNSASTLSSALQAVLTQSVAPWQLVVVDNGSTDGSAAIVRGMDDGVPLQSNLGYARGMNIGYDRVVAEYVCFLNDDVILHPEFVERACDILDRRPEIDCVAPLVVRTPSMGVSPPWVAEGPAVIDGGPIALTKLMRVRLLDAVTHSRPVDKPNGACPVYRMSAISAVKAAFGVAPFDPSFTTYGEDIDLALKLLRLGRLTMYMPSVAAAHLRSASSAKVVGDKRGILRQYILSARYINALRHLRRGAAGPIWVVLVVQDIGFAFLRSIRGDFRAVADVLQAWAMTIGRLPPECSARRGTGARKAQPGRVTPQYWSANRRQPQTLNAADLRRAIG